MSWKTYLISKLIDIFNAIGITAFLFQKDPRRNYKVIDLNYFNRYYSNKEFIQIYYEALENTNSISRDQTIKQFRYFIVYQMVHHILNSKVAGDIVECGCWRGHSAYIIARILQNRSEERLFFIFDSFEGGLSDKTDEDKKLQANIDAEIVREEKASFYSTTEEVGKNLSEFSFISLHKGWIPEPFPVVSDRKFSFVHLDLDLYQPIKDCLEFFYPRMTKGGIIVVDDYGTTGWPGVTSAVDQFIKKNNINYAIDSSVGNFIIFRFDR